MKWLPIFRKELKTYFISPIAYVILFIYSLITGFISYSIAGYYNLFSVRAASSPYGGAPPLNPTEMIASPLFHNMAITALFMMPLLTMRLFAEEKKSDTIELLFTWPLRDIDILVGKFVAALAVFAAMVGLSLVYFGMLEIWLNFDWPVLLSGYLGLLLLGASFISAGILISAQTDNQIVAAASAFGLLLLFWLVSWAAELAGPKMQGLFNFLSLFEHYENFPKGILDTKDIVYYASFIWIFQFLTLRTLASKRYRG